jgi:threonyl-tRNA synthetase
LQVDFFMPERLGAEYVDADDRRRVPIMLHRAVLGSLERFIGMLVEHYAGALPPWLAPRQVVVCCISEPSADYAMQVTQTLKKQGFRVYADLRSEKITYKIREHSLQKVPYILIVGDKERAANQVAVRVRGGLDLGTLKLDNFIARLATEVTQRCDTGGADEALNLSSKLLNIL